MNNASFNACSVLIIKQHCLTAGVHGQIVQRVLDSGLEISSVGLRRLRPADAADFMEAYREVLPECEELVRDLSTGTSLALEVRGENAVEAVRDLCGPYDPDIAKSLRPNTLRAQFGLDRVHNAVHCTDLPEDGPSDSEFLFKLVHPDL